MERVSVSRWRWRLRGAWLGPLFPALTLVDAVLIHNRPLLGDGAHFVGALLLAGFLNLFLVAFVAPVLALAVRRRRPDLPSMVARDYTGSALIATLTATFAIGGTIHHRVLVEQAAAEVRAQHAAAEFVLGSAPLRYRSGVPAMDTIKVESGMYRACVPGPQADRPYCVIVRTDTDPPGITEDGHTPNSLWRAGGGY
jgi:uncharacterized membrane protein YhaH (DUF805 family)